jgi:TP901 family phage tail tape measure protein
MADTQSNIKVSIDTAEALANIKNLQRQISAFHTSMAKGGAAANAVTAQMQQGLINSINATGKFSAQMKTIRTTTESFTNSLEKNKFAMGEYFRYAGGASKTFGRLFKSEFDTINKVARENVKDLQTQYIKMGRDANGAMKAIAVRPLSLDMNDLATKTMIASEKQALLNQLLKQGSTNLLNFGKNTQWAGRQLMVGFTLPLMAVGSAAAKTFMDMETQAIRFKKVYGDLFTPQEESKQALEDIQNLGKEFTKYGIAVSSTVGLAAEAAAAGFQGVDLQRQTAAATKLSILGQVESQKALETTISLQNAFSMSSANLAESIDFLNAVENQTVLSLDDMSTAIPKAAPVVQQLGGDVKDLAFLMTAMKEGGINASEGANALKSGLASLINPTGKANDMLLSFGINAKKIVEDNRGDLKKTVIDFASALNQLDPLNRAQVIEQMFGKFQFARLSTLFANVTKEGTQAARVLDLAGSSVQELAALSEKELGMTSESAMNKFKGAVESLKLSLVPVGEEFLKAVTPIAEFVTKILDRFNNLGEGTKKIIVTMTAIVAGLGPVLLMTFGLLANGVANIIKGFTAMKTLFNKTGQSSATLGTEVRYMTLEQRNAAAVASSLDQVHRNLAQTFTAEATSVDRLTAAYARSIAAQQGFMPTGIPFGRGPIKKRAKGKPATVGGTGNQDSELAYLMPGETVIPTDMSKKYGGLINGMIADSIPGYKNGKSSSGNRSMYGGQERILAPYTMMAPGNKPGGFGMDEAFLASEDFARSLTNTAVAAGSIEGKIRLTDKSMDDLANLATPYAQEITDELRLASQEMAKTGKSATHISQLFDTKKKEINSILSRMAASGSQGSAMARGLQVTAYPTDTDIRTGGNVRVPGVDVDPQGNVVRAAPRSVRSGRASQFQTKIGRITSRRPLDTQERITRAHVVPEERVLAGGIMPLGGGALGLPEEQQRAARLELEKRNIKLSQQLGIKNAQAYDSGVKSVKVKDPYEQSRNKKSPHRLAAKDGADDGKAYTVAQQKSIDRHNRKLAKQRKPAIGQSAAASTPTRTQRLMAGAKGMPGRMNSMGGGMGLLGANIGLSMLPDFAGKGLAQGALAGANLGMMFGPYGMAAGAAIGAVSTAVSGLIEKQKELRAVSEATFKGSADVAKFFGNAAASVLTPISNLANDLSMVAKAGKDVKSSLGLSAIEISNFSQMVESLPKENPLATIVRGISDESNPEKIKDLGQSFVTMQVALGQIKPEDGQKLLDLILTASGKSNMVGALTVNIKTQAEAIKKSIDNSATSFNTLKLTIGQTMAAAANSTSLEQLQSYIDGIAASGYNGAAGINALRQSFLDLGNVGAANIVSGLERRGLKQSEIVTVIGAVNKGLSFNAKGKSGKDILKLAIDFNKKAFQPPKTGGSATNPYKSQNDSLEGQNKLIDSQIKALEKRKKLIDEEIAAQKKITNELKRQNDFEESQAQLESQIVNAKLRGNFIEAANLKREQMNKTLEYQQEGSLTPLEDQSSKLQDQIDALKEKKDANSSTVNSNNTNSNNTNSGNTITNNYASGPGVVSGMEEGSFKKPFPTSSLTKAYQNAPQLKPKIGGALNPGLDPSKWNQPGLGFLLGAASTRSMVKKYAEDQGFQQGQFFTIDHNNLRYKFKVDNKKGNEGNIIMVGKPVTIKKEVKKANGGLIKGPGTGRSDSIRATLGYAGGGSIRVSNGEFVVKASSVGNYGIDKMNAVNNGTADIITNSGGTSNTNVTMYVTGSNSDEIAKKVMVELDRLQRKNNKTNMVAK